MTADSFQYGTVSAGAGLFLFRLCRLLFGFRQTAVTDGRGNTTITAYNALDQVLYTEDAATNRTTYAYDALGRRTEVTDALGNVTHTRYDSEGRATKSWGATYPVEYGYDAQGRMVSMKTFRDENGPGDETRWLYENPTGLFTNKLYADGKGPSYTYTSAGQLASRTWARLDPGTGLACQTLYAYDAAGSLLGVDYSDTTPDIAYTYDRLGNMASVADASGTRTFVHSPDGQTLADAVQFQNDVFTLHEAYDTFGLSSGYALSNTVDGVSSMITGMAQVYDAFGRISEVCVEGISAPFRYDWLPGSDLQQFLAMPNGLTRQTTYDPHRDLLVSITHSNAVGTVLTRRTFIRDAAARLTARTQYRLGDETNRFDAFGYNPRAELISAALGTNGYSYVFDLIGNRQTADEPNFSATYAANTLNQYTNISYGQPLVFTPAFDADGNQTLIRTSTGIWHVRYNGENRPVWFSNEVAVIDMDYDYKGRRFLYRETVSNIVTRHERYLYRNNLRIAALDMRDNAVVIHALVWDPAEAVATRPLLLSTPSGWHTYGFDQVKNVTELFNAFGELSATYDYSPFGTITDVSGAMSDLNPFVFSSEVGDSLLALVYYNCRHLNSQDGRWINGDPIEEKGFQRLLQKKSSNITLYSFVSNDVMTLFDILGLAKKRDPKEGGVRCSHTCQLQIEGCDMAAIYTAVPKECCEEHEYTHLSDVMLEGDWCSYDKKGCCIGAGEYADSASYQSQPPQDNDDWRSTRIHECRAWKSTIDCCKKKGNEDCVKLAESKMRGSYWCHLGDIQY